jgi:hypothetical protein
VISKALAGFGFQMNISILELSTRENGKPPVISGPVSRQLIDALLVLKERANDLHLVEMDIQCVQYSDWQS